MSSMADKSVIFLLLLLCSALFIYYFYITVSIETAKEALISRKTTSIIRTTNQSMISIDQNQNITPITTITPPISIDQNQNPPLILGWNNFHQNGNVMDVLRGAYNMEKCPYKCLYSSNKSLENSASIIVFHIRNEHGELPKQRRSDQLYTFFLDESPTHTHTWVSDDYYKLGPSFFNLTMTYRKDSDIWNPYDTFEPFDEGENENDMEQRWTDEQVDTKIRQKSKLALQLVTNCATPSKREHFVKELEKFMNITLMGNCFPTKCNQTCGWEAMDSHFFFLAFENSVCYQYITEKFWNIKRLIVPVVLSRKVFANLSSIPPDSLMAADDFSSPRALADHLEATSKNFNEYKRFFDWTKRFKRTNCHQSTMNGLCKLCKMAHEKPANKIIPNIWSFWEPPGVCWNNLVDQFLPKSNKTE